MRFTKQDKAALIKKQESAISQGPGVAPADLLISQIKRREPERWEPPEKPIVRNKFEMYIMQSEQLVKTLQMAQDSMQLIDDKNLIWANISITLTDMAWLKIKQICSQAEKKQGEDSMENAIKSISKIIEADNACRRDPSIARSNQWPRICFAICRRQIELVSQLWHKRGGLFHLTEQQEAAKQELLARLKKANRRG